MDKLIQAIGLILLIGSCVFVGQATRVAWQVFTLPDPQIRTDASGDLVADIETVPAQDLGPTKYAFLALQAWLPLAAVSAARQRRVSGKASSILLVSAALALALILVGHFEAVWLKRQGTSVGLW